jgi:hypothetical protein
VLTGTVRGQADKTIAWGSASVSTIEDIVPSCSKGWASTAAAEAIRIGLDAESA